MTTTSILDMQQAQGESACDYVARLKGLGILAEEAVRDAQTLQQHCISLYRAALKSGAGLRDASEAVLRAGAQLARAKKRRDDVEYALFEALQVWDGE
jgi:hypothetical protein